jgi:hypothetical protein
VTIPTPKDYMQTLRYAFDDDNNAFRVLQSSPDFLMRVALGLIPGVTQMKKFAFNPSCPVGVERDIWDYGATTFGNRNYIYPADGTAPIDTLSSSDAGDTQNTEIEGLNILGVLVTQTKQLDGQNKVTLDTPLWRVHRMRNVDAQTTSDRTVGYAGNIYCYEDTPIVGGVPTDTTKVRAFIFDGNNQTLMSQFTTPCDTTSLFVWRGLSIANKQASASVVRGYVRPYGSVWTVANVEGQNTQGSGLVSVESKLLQPIPAKTDIVVAVDVGTNAIGQSAQYDILIFDNEIWGL